MNDDEFDIILNSNCCKDIFVDNSPGNFKNLLSKRHNLTGNWTVALTQICIPITWSEQKLIVVKFLDVITSRSYTALEPITTTFEWRNNPAELAEHLISTLHDDIFSKQIEFYYNFISKTLTVSSGEISLQNGEKIHVMPVFDEQTNEMLGLPQLKPKQLSITSQKPVSVLYNEVFSIETNIIEPICFGYKEKPILNYITTKSDAKYGENLIIYFPQDQKRKLRLTNFESISINIKDSKQNIPSFEFGTSFATLKFKRDAF